MADSLSITPELDITWSLIETVEGDSTLGMIYDSSSVTYKETLADGTSADEAEVVWRYSETLADSSHTDYALNGLALTLFGESLSLDMGQLKGIYIENQNTTAGQDITLTNSGPSNAHTALFNAETAAVITIPAGSVFMAINKKGTWLADATHDGLRISNSSGSAVAYRIALFGHYS